MALGFFISSTVLYLLKPVIHFHESIAPALWWAVLGGVIWAIGSVCFVKSIDALGLARSNQWKNLQGPVGVILSLIILSEFESTNWLFAVLAGLSIFASAAFFSIFESKKESKANRRGINLALISALAFGSVAVINKYVTTHVGIYSQQVVWSFAIFLSLAVYMLLRRNHKVFNVRKREAGLGLFAGVIYLGASFFMLQSLARIPASIGFTIIQMSAIWTILIGLIFFKEIDYRKHYSRIIGGFLFAIIGIVLLAFAHK